MRSSWVELVASKWDKIHAAPRARTIDEAYDPGTGFEQGTGFVDGVERNG